MTFLSSVLAYFSAYAQTNVNFNFSAGSQPVSGWINVAGDPSTGVRTATDPVSRITISSISASNWLPSVVSAYDGQGETSGGPFFFPPAVLLNHWYQYNGAVAGYNPGLPQLLITGLQTDSAYTLRMTGSSTSSSVSGPTMYTVSGLSVSGPIAVNNYDNTASGAVFYNVAPDATGSIKVYVNTTPNTMVADICGLQVTAAPLPYTSYLFENGLTQTGNTVSLGGTTRLGQYAAVLMDFKDTTKPLFDANINYGFHSVNLVADNNDTVNKIASGTGIDIGDFNGVSNDFDLSAYQYSVSQGNGSVYVYGVAESHAGGSGLSMTVQDPGQTNPGGGIELYGSGMDFIGPAIEFRNFLNDANGDSVLVTDTQGNLHQKALSSFSNTSSHWLPAGAGIYDSLDNVGIGTSNTQGYKLAVNGNAIFQRVVVKPYSNWPDYVFGKPYRLPTLGSLREYLAKNGHLPGVPAAAEIQTKGIDVGANQAILLKKVEELTLYLLNENEMIRKQQREIDKLKKLLRKK